MLTMDPSFTGSSVSYFTQDVMIHSSQQWKGNSAFGTCGMRLRPCLKGPWWTILARLRSAVLLLYRLCIRSNPCSISSPSTPLQYDGWIILTRQLCTQWEFVLARTRVGFKEISPDRPFLQLSGYPITVCNQCFYSASTIIDAVHTSQAVPEDVWSAVKDKISTAFSWLKIPTKSAESSPCLRTIIPEIPRERMSWKGGGRWRFLGSTIQENIFRVILKCMLFFCPVASCNTK